jgi:peptidoglycan/LPS O-acetylase OafA/YrhL
MCNFGRHRVAVGALAVVFAPVYLFLFNAGKNLDATAVNGIVRCIYGFAMGVLVQAFLADWKHEVARLAGRKYVATSAEITIFFLAAFYMAMAGTGVLSLAAPLVFSIVVIVFSTEAGLVSRLLQTRPFVTAGLLSYSVYMVHHIILGLWIKLAPVAEHRLGEAGFLFKLSDPSGGDASIAAGNFGGLALLFLLVLAASAFTYNLVEEPARRKSRDWLDRVTGTPSTSSNG